MKWKNVLLLIGADIKSYRLVSVKSFRRFQENKVFTYALYIGACLLGSSIGWLVGNLYSGITDSQIKGLILQNANIFFVSFPTVALLYGLVFTQMSQIQRIGTKVSVQPLYWFPITWEEHTLASTIANVLGIPLAVTIFISFGIVAASIFMGLVPMAFFTIFTLLVSTFMASATTEVTKILQVRASGAVTKVAGRAAIWVRLIGSILFFIVFYAIYFSLYYQTNALILLQMVASGQKLLWFIPYVWPGVALSYMASGSVLETLVFSLASIAFIYALFLAATKLNVRYGLYEIPAIRISTGAYVSRASFLTRMGFSSLETAIMRKDFKAFTRRQELTFIFLFPVIFAIMPVLSAMRTGTGAPTPSALYALHSFLFAYLTLLPGAIMAIMLGTMMIGMEGGSVWYFYSSPISARSLVRAKYAFTALFSLAVMLVCSIIAGVLFTPSAGIAVLSVAEAFFLVFALSVVSLSFGIKGPDFSEHLRRRMIRTKWALINGLVCTLLALTIVSPIIPYTLSLVFETIGSSVGISLPISEAYLYIALPASGIIACLIAYIFYRIALRNAEGLLTEAEVEISI